MSSDDKNLIKGRGSGSFSTLSPIIAVTSTYGSRCPAPPSQRWWSRNWSSHHYSIELWSQKSEAREGEYADYYLWADPAPGGGPPNNWLSKVSNIFTQGIALCTHHRESCFIQIVFFSAMFWEWNLGEKLRLELVRKARTILLPSVPGAHLYYRYSCILYGPW